MPDSRDDEDVRGLLEQAEPNDTLARWELLRTIERGLFGVPEELQQVGRYRVLTKIGSGGQGSVYVAYDPDLDRQVAVKLVRSDRRRHPEARARLLREAMALAQLAHPNVIAVNDVGECDAGVFVVTQLVAGVTLGRWLVEPRSWQAIVATFVEAGQGLVAAHACGIVHRDFKPANVLIGESPPSVLLLDFGLARAMADGDSSESDDPGTPPAIRAVPGSGTITVAGDVMGTPTYMAPEQHLGRTATAAADQYAFCVALYQALWGVAPFPGETIGEIAHAKLVKWPPPRPCSRDVPTALRRLIERGLSPDPDDRWPSMQALVERMRGFARPRRGTRLALGGAAIGLALVAGAGALVFGRQALMRPCDDPEAWSATWSASRSERLVAAFEASGQTLAGDAATRIVARVDDYARAWIEARGETCAALQRDPAADVRIACLERARVALDETLGVLEHADASVVLRADEAIGELEDPAQCRGTAVAEPTSTVSARVAEQRALLARGRALAAAGRYADALAELEPVMASAATIGYAPLVAEAGLAYGEVLQTTDALDDAARVLEDAFLAAEFTRHDAVAFEAAVALARLFGVDREDAEQARTWSRRAESALGRIGPDDDPVLQGALALVTAAVAERAGDYPAAIRENRRAVERFETERGAADPRTARATRSLAHVLGRAGELDEALATARTAVALAEGAVGSEHPIAAEATRTLAWVLKQRGEFAASLELAQRAYELFERAYGPDHIEVATTLGSIAVLHSEMGRPHEAEAAYARALAIQEKSGGRRSPAVARTLHNLAITQRDLGRWDEAIATWREAIAIASETLGPNHLEVGLFSLTFGGLLADSGRIDEALDVEMRALAIVRARLGDEHPRTIMAFVTLGHTQRRAGDLAGARMNLELGVERAEHLLGPEHAETGRVLQELAYLRADEGDLDEALATSERALAILEASLGPQHTALADVLTSLAHTHEALGHHADAAAANARAGAIWAAAGADLSGPLQPD